MNGSAAALAARSDSRLGRQFGLLWAGQTVSNVGDRITLFVIPTLMIFAMGASAFQVGLISMAQYLAIPVLSLVAGVLADRWDLRRMLIACDLVRFVAIAAIPVAYWQGFLSVPLLFCCVVVISAATVFFNIGYVPTLTVIVPRTELVRANSRLETSRMAAEVGGPAIGSGLYRGLGVAALVVDAATYLFSAVCLLAMRPTGAKPARTEGLRVRLMVGIRQNWRDPVLRRCTAGTLLANIGGPIFVTQLPVLAYQGLGLSVGAFGTIMTVAAVGAVIGALVAPAVSRRLGPARVMSWAMPLHSLCGLGILLTAVAPAVVVLAATLTSYLFFFAWYNICSQSVRQARMPVADQAVIYAAYRTVTWGVIPVSAFLGGVVVSLLAAHVDIRTAVTATMIGGTVIGLSAYLPLAPVQPMLDRAAAEEREGTADGRP
ncbi:MFS transporter [Plantactinospora sp. GCM10030261]|uniref:MFS transporter n=1 Tax=Plantactinospora sp. GCM10030261 TaxID=3273420 RepID=UPI0036183741